MEIIKSIKSNALTITQLQVLVGPENTLQCRWMLWDDLQKFKSMEELMAKKAAVILLQIESKNSPNVGHFIILLDHGTHIEHFDSYGLTMEEELKITEEHHLTRIFKNYRKPIINNTKRLQTLREDVNTCGRWVVARLLLRNMELNMFLQLLKYFSINSDDLVAAMTLLLQFKK